jgi:L-seryl-tRNA(Ser) seleniumtransferase
LQLFLHKEKTLLNNHGVMSIILRPIKDIKRQASLCARKLKKQFSKQLEISLQKDLSEIGGGSLSTEQLPTFVVAVKPKIMAAQDLARALRTCDIPIYGRVSEGVILLDFRTVLRKEEQYIINAFNDVFKTI